MSDIVEIIKQGYIARLDVDTGRITSLTDGSFEAVDKEGNFGAVTYTENGAQNIYTHRFVERPEDEPGLVLEDRLSDLHHRGGYSFANDKPVEIETDNAVEIILCDTKIKVISGLLQDDGIRVTVTPDNRKIIFSEEK